MPWTKQHALQLGLRIRELRLLNGLTQETLAYRAGITKNQIQLIEAGRGSPGDPLPGSNPKASTLVGIAEVLSVKPGDLLNEAVTPPA
ncbi:XRE family transcriptional regulator [Arthrobacter crusticola]|uniref:XRE family transcriptional regulator n=1 Tax=Arthrobacter crusticola TaxID=2547960 RepID=A0A4V3ALM0_9MICC|nr:XRE family transcriptional regulator [Arthrobacter crusticola]